MTISCTTRITSAALAVWALAGMGAAHAAEAVAPAKGARPAAVAAPAAAALPAVAPAVDQAIRKGLVARVPNLPAIDEVRATPIAGLYEVRYAGSELLYSDPKGEYIVINGAMIETATRTDLTEARIEKLLAMDFSKLPLQDAIAIKQGNGSRKLVVFADPNCGYCKRLERDLAQVKDVTVYTFLLPILGPDSTAKARDIWCAKDPGKTWRTWMIDGAAPTTAMGKCDTAAIDRALELGRKYRVNGTPAIVFEDGTRKPGAVAGDVIERLLAAAAKKS